MNRLVLLSVMSVGKKPPDVKADSKRIIFFITRNDTVLRTVPNSTFDGAGLPEDLVCSICNLSTVQ